MNELFLKRMSDYLKDEYDAYYQSLENDLYKGLSLNQAKCDVDFLRQQFPYDLEKSTFSRHGYKLPFNVKVGNHWTHLAGLYYLQEPSASSAVEVLDVQEGDWVLDLCAAPGGKSNQIAAALNNTGFLLSNEIDSKRAKILLSNLERCGVSENMITSAAPEKLCPQIKGWFDRVLVDAPCSGEGMMKKHELAQVEWSQENVEACASRQLYILDEAVKTLKKGGILVYSTCTYAIEENEGVVCEFLRRHPEMELVDCGPSIQRCGLPYGDFDSSKVRRIFPMDGGEGHFVAKMRKNEATETSKIKEAKDSKVEACVTSFIEDQLSIQDYHLLEVNGKIYMRKNPFIQLDKIQVLREGCCVGEVIKKRIEPHHHFYTTSQLIPYYKHKVELNEEELAIYLSGNVLQKEAKGYVVLCYQGIPVGFGKGDGNMIKNKYPKGLRVQG